MSSNLGSASICYSVRTLDVTSQPEQIFCSLLPLCRDIHIVMMALYIGNIIMLDKTIIHSHCHGFARLMHMLFFIAKLSVINKNCKIVPGVTKQT